MVRDVSAQDHFDYDLSDIPILSFRQKLKDIILWI